MQLRVTLYHPNVGYLCFTEASVLNISRAALEKLAIRGIRSFDDKRVEVVQFFTPVTVIVGQNGSGKTVSITFDVTIALI